MCGDQLVLVRHVNREEDLFGQSPQAQATQRTMCETSIFAENLECSACSETKGADIVTAQKFNSDGQTGVP